MARQGPCFHCGVGESPYWREGPPHKPTLCNACGTRWRLKRSLEHYLPKNSGTRRFRRRKFYLRRSRSRSRSRPAIIPNLLEATKWEFEIPRKKRSKRPPPPPPPPPPRQAMDIFHQQLLDILNDPNYPEIVEEEPLEYINYNWMMDENENRAGSRHYRPPPQI